MTQKMISEQELFNLQEKNRLHRNLFLRISSELFLLGLDRPFRSIDDRISHWAGRFNHLDEFFNFFLSVICVYIIDGSDLGKTDFSLWIGASQAVRIDLSCMFD